MNNYRKFRVFKRFIAVMMVTCLATLAYAEEGGDFISRLTLQPSSEPVLQIENSRHNGLITVISTDSQGRFLLTASEDKTLRLWNIASGKLIKTYHMPIGARDQGKLYATAISPDGRYLAVGGHLGYEWEFSYSIFIIERESGNVVKRINRLGDISNHLVFSHDGQYLAGLLGQEGLKVWDARNDFVEVASDNDYQSATYWLDFSSRGELVTTSEDGLVRLYDKSFKLKKKTKVIADKTPVGVAFSPDGKKLVIGFLEAHSIVVASAEDLSVLYEPDVSGIVMGDIAVVKWGQDGAVYAGGTYSKLGAIQIRRWGNGGSGAYQDISCSESTIMDFNVLTDGRVVSVDNKPEVSLIAADGQLLYRLGSGAALASIVGNELYINADGSAAAVTLWGEEGISGRLQFDAAKQKLSLHAGKPEQMHAPKMESAKLKVEEWHGSSKPTVNGVLLGLDMFEFSNALAISIDDRFFVLGTNKALRRYDADGLLVWEKDTAKTVRSVNLSTDGKTIVAVLGDQTMRWYNAESGEELVALYIHNDKERWVAWTPEGYFSHSVNGADLAGYVVNSDKDNIATFVSFSKLGERLHQPEKLQSKVKGVRVDDVRNVLLDLISAAARKVVGHG